MFSHKGTDDLDLDRQTKAIYLQGNITINKFRVCSDEVKLQLFQTYCINMYAAHLWSQYTVEVFNKVKVAYNDIFRALMDIGRRSSISAAFVQRNICTFNALQRKRIYGFYTRMLASDNKLVRCIINSPFFIYGSHISAHWQKQLYLSS